MIGKHFFYIAHFFLYCKFFLCDFKFRDMTQQKLLSDLSVHSVITLMLANCANKSRDLAATSNTIQNQSTSKHASSTRIYISHDFTNKPIHTIAGVPSITFVTLHPLVLTLLHPSGSQTVDPPFGQSFSPPSQRWQWTSVQKDPAAIVMVIPSLSPLSALSSSSPSNPRRSVQDSVARSCRLWDLCFASTRGKDPCGERRGPQKAGPVMSSLGS